MAEHGVAVIVAPDGRLVDVSGTNREAHARYAKFAKRLLGDSGASAVLDYGWNSRGQLVVTSSGAKEKITLDAAAVSVSGDLEVGGTPLQTLIDDAADLAIHGVQGTSDISVRFESNDSSGPDDPRVLCTIGLSDDFLNRMETLERKVATLFRFDEAYLIGDGLEVERDENENTLKVRLGTGLKFEPADVSSDSSGSPEPETMAIAVDTSVIPSPRYVVDVDETSGNAVLYDTLED